MYKAKAKGWAVDAEKGAVLSSILVPMKLPLRLRNKRVH